MQKMASSLIAIFGLVTASSLCLAEEYAKLFCDPQAIPEYDQAPEILWQAPPVYPEKLRKNGNVGDVKVALQINADGSAQDFEIRQSLHPSLETAVIDALLQARYKPAVKNGMAIGSKVCLPVIFKMNDSLASFSIASGVVPYQFPAESSKELPLELQYDRAPSLKVVTAAVYPYELAIRKIEGSAKVSFLIGPQGTVLETQVLEASHPDFGLAAAAMLESWRFQPAQKNGQPSAAIFVKEVNFSAADRDTGLSDSSKLFMEVLENKQPEIVSLAELDKPPKALYQVMPINPKKRLEQSTGETVILEFFLDTQGAVQLPRIVEAHTPALAWSALTALARWRFEPPLKQGKPVLAKIQIPFQFTDADAAH